MSLMSPALAGGFFTSSTTWEAHYLLGSPVNSAHRILTKVFKLQASQVELVVENLPANAGCIRNMGSIPGSGRSSGEWHSSSLQCSCLENPMDRGAGKLWSIGSQRVGHDWSKLVCMHIQTPGVACDESQFYPFFMDERKSIVLSSFKLNGGGGSKRITCKERSVRRRYRTGVQFLVVLVA